MELPDELRALFDRATTAANALSPSYVREEHEACDALLVEAMTAAAFPPHDPKRGQPASYDTRTVYRAASLTPTQRAAAVFLALHPELPTFKYPLPGAPWAIRRWLGLDPPGVLFEEQNGRTPYEALRSFPTGYEPFHAYLETLPRRDRVQALTDWSLLRADCLRTPVNELHALLPEIDNSLGAWALARAQWLLRHHPDPRNAESVSRAPLPMHIFTAVSPPIYVALMRAGLSNVPSFDALLPLGQWCAVTPAWQAQTQCELVNAIPEERREAALLGAVNNLMFDQERVIALQQVLPSFPYPAVAAYILRHAHEARYPQRALDAVLAVSDASPDIATLYRAHMSALGDIPKLRVVSFTAAPLFNALTQAQRDQLEARGRPWNLSAKELLTQVPGTEHELNLVLVDDGEGPALEAWLNEGNEGSIFRAGTTEEVAWMSQGGIPQCEDKALLAALRDALSGKHLNALRAASGASAEGPWAAYRDALGHCEASDAGRWSRTEISGDGTLPPLIVPKDDDVPF